MKYALVLAQSNVTDNVPATPANDPATVLQVLPTADAASVLRDSLNAEILSRMPDGYSYAGAATVYRLSFITLPVIDTVVPGDKIDDNTAYWQKHVG